MNIASVLVVLQMAVSLLTASMAPGTPANIQAQATSFANQAVAMASEALAQPTTTQLGAVPTSNPVSATITPSSTTINYTPPVQTQITTPSLATAPAPISNTCTITGTVLPDVTNMGVNLVSFAWAVNGVATDTPGQLYLPNGHAGPQFIWLDSIPLTSSTKSATIYSYWKANIDGATCWTFMPINPTAGTQTTSNIPNGMRGMNFN